MKPADVPLSNRASLFKQTEPPLPFHLPSKAQFATMPAYRLTIELSGQIVKRHSLAAC